MNVSKRARDVLLDGSVHTVVWLSLYAFEISKTIASSIFYVVIFCYFVCQFSARFFSPFVLRSHSVQMRTYIRNWFRWVSEWVCDCLSNWLSAIDPNRHTVVLWSNENSAVLFLCFFFFVVVVVAIIIYCVIVVWIWGEQQNISLAIWFSWSRFPMEMSRKIVCVHVCSSFEANWIENIFISRWKSFTLVCPWIAFISHCVCVLSVICYGFVWNPTKRTQRALKKPKTEKKPCESNERFTFPPVGSIRWLARSSFLLLFQFSEKNHSKKRENSLRTKSVNRIERTSGSMMM